MQPFFGMIWRTSAAAFGPKIHCLSTVVYSSVQVVNLETVRKYHVMQVS